jgi:TP901 family phage tail tape measure protein
MAKKITPNDLFSEADIFRGIRDSATKTIEVMNKLQGELAETAQALKKSIGGAKFDSATAIKNFTKETTTALKITQEFEKTQKAAAVAEQQRQKALQQVEITSQKRNRTKETELNLSRKQAQEADRLNKKRERAAKLANDESNAYKKLVKNTRDLKNESKRLGAEMLHLEQTGRKNTAEYRKLASQYKNVTAAAKRGDVQLKKLDRTVGDNFRNVGNYRAALGKLSGALGAMGVAFGLAGILRNVTGTIVGFDQAVADLAAISGKTKEELSGLNEQAKKLGATSQFTSTEITQMQIELAKLGFTTQQISESTEAVSNFAAATGADMASAAKVAGGALRGFNLEASEMERVVSVLGVATTKSALDFQAYETSLSKIAPVANAFGFSIEDTTALLGQLANAGFDASSAATATRNILLKMADSGGDLAVALGRPVKNADDLAEGLQKLQSEGIDLASALELTDKRSVAAFETFLKGSDSLVDFRDSITDVNQELKDMAAKRLDSVQGKLTLLSSAWDGFVINLGESMMASQGLKAMLGFLAENLTTIIGVIGKLIRAFVVYKGTLMALRVAQRLYNTDFSALGKQMSAQIPMTRAYKLEQIQLARAQAQGTTATKAATSAIKGFGTAFASMGIFLIIAAVTELAAAWYDVASGARAARLEEELQNKAAEQAAEISSKIIENADKEFRAKEKAINKEMRKRRAAGEDMKKLDEEKMQRLRDNAAETSKLIKKEIATRTDEFGDIAKATQIAKYFERGGKRDGSSFFDDVGNTYTKSEFQNLINPMLKAMNMGTGVNRAQAGNIKSAVDAYANQQLAILDKLEAEEEKYNEILEDRILTMEELAQERKKGDKASLKSSKTIKTDFRNQNRFISQQMKLLQDLMKIEQQRDLIKSDKAIDAEFEKQMKNIENNKTFEVDTLNTLIDEKVEANTNYIKVNAENDKQALKEKYDAEAAARLTALNKERDDLLKGAAGNTNKQGEILANYQVKLDELKDDEVKRKEDLDLEILIIEENTQNEILKIQEDGFEKKEKLNEDLVENKKERDEEEIALELKKYERINEIVRLATDFFIKQSDRKIAQIEKEIAAAQKQYDYLQQLAANGNIDAKESLAEQQKIINEANAKKLKEQQNKARIELISSAYQTYNSKLAANVENPLSSTIADITLLQSFINSLPAFYDGTEDTGINGRGVDGKGGFHAILHPNERVVPKNINDQLKGITNTDLAKMAMSYKVNKSVGEYMGAEQIGNGYELLMLGSKLDDLKNVIQNKPETNIELGEITQSLMEIVETSKKGNKVTYNRFKVKK